MEEAHVRALTRGEMSLRRAEETAGDLERVSFKKPHAFLGIELALSIHAAQCQAAFASSFQ